MRRFINPYEEQPLPEFEEEALVVTATGVSGYSRPKNIRYSEAWCVEERYVLGSSWEPKTITWENVERIELFHADSECWTLSLDDPTQQDPELGCAMGFGCCYPCIAFSCCERSVANYTGLRIESKTYLPAASIARLEGEYWEKEMQNRQEIQVIALKEDPDHVVEALKAAWFPSLSHALASSGKDLNTIHQKMAVITKKSKRDITKRDGSTVDILSGRDGILRQYREELIGKMDSETARRAIVNLVHNLVHCGRYTRASGQGGAGYEEYHYCSVKDDTCERCRIIITESKSLLDQRLEECVGQMEINAIHAELEREDLDDAEYSAWERGCQAEYSAMLTEMLTKLE